jgi:hypothetical protein
MKDFDTDQVEAVEAEDGVSEEIRSAFKESYDAGKDEDIVKIDMISAGAKFKQVTKIFNELMIEFGYAVSKEEKQKAVEDAVGGNDLSTEEGFDAAVSALVASVDSMNERGAGTSIRAYARKNDIDCFKKPKAVGGGTRTTFLSDFYDALVENPAMTEGEADEFIKENGTANTIRWAKTHQKAREMANKIAEKYA